MRQHLDVYGLPAGSLAVRSEMQANRDELTGLYNRRYVLYKLAHMLADPELDPERYVVMYMDLNKFKAVNDGSGHEQGDKVLKSVGRHLQLRRGDIASRLGGDEFLVIVDTEDKPTDRRSSDRDGTGRRNHAQTRDEIVRGLTEHIRSEVQQGAAEAGHSSVTASIGVVDLSKYTDVEKLLGAADEEMYREKRSGR